MKSILAKSKILYVILSITFVIAGIILIAFPKTSAETICCMIGIITLICGIVKILGYFSNDIYQLAFQFDLALGIFTILISVLLIIHPETIIAIVPVVVGLIVLVDSIFKFQTSLDAWRFGLKRWWMIFIFALVTAGLGFVLVLNPFKATDILMIMMGISLIFHGIQNIWITLYTVKYVKKIND